MSPEETAPKPKPKRIAVIWSPEARADLRAINRETALDILHCPYNDARLYSSKKISFGP